MLNLEALGEHFGTILGSCLALGRLGGQDVTKVVDFPGSTQPILDGFGSL